MHPPPRAHRGEAGILEPKDALPALSFGDLPERLQQAASRAGWTSLMPVQSKAIPYLLARRDLMIQSRTGSGKTGAFILPMLERIDPARDACQALVLVPTRELAQQVAHEGEVLAEGTGFRVATVCGGVAYGPQLSALRRGAHLVVGTPGRVLDHLLRRSLTLEGIDILVFDEADRMLSMGFYPDMKRIDKYLPQKGYNAYMFSATFPPRVMSLAGQFLDRPELLSLSRDHIHVLETEHVYYTVPAMDKDRCLVRIIEVENPDSALIFCNTKTRVNYVSVVLQRFGYDADALSSDLTQQERTRVLGRIRKGNLRFLVATDVAARGLDIPDLSHVILYDTPEDPELYIHRAGRTGRAGASGVAISLVAGLEEMELKSIARRFGVELVARPLPTEEEVQALVSQRVVAHLEARLRSRDSLEVERMKRFVPLARGLGGGDDELAVLAMLLDESYQALLRESRTEEEAAETTEPPRDSGAPAPPPEGRRKRRHRR
jgi:ATP-dependent RNA helicase DeaD